MSGFCFLSTVPIDILNNEIFDAIDSTNLGNQ